MNRFLMWLRRVFVERGEDLALTAATEQQARIRSATDVLLEGLRTTRQGNEPVILVGRDATTGAEIEVPARELVGVSRWTIGSTGSGKTFGLLCELLCMLVPRMPWSLVLYDGKSEFCPLISELILPAELSAWSEQDARAFLARYRVLDPFASDALPPFNVVAPVIGVPASLQSREITQLVHDSLGPSNNNLGARMVVILSYALRLALDVGGLSLLEVRSLLTNRSYLDRLLTFCTDAEIREYFVCRFPTENRESIHGIASRLDILLLVPETRAVLCAPGCISFADLLEGGGLSTLNVGNPPRGAEFISAFFAGILVRGLVRAIMGRPLTAATLPVFCLLDEWWTALDADTVNFFERVLHLARHRKAGLWLVNQAPGQIGSRYPALLASLKNACGTQTAFRQSIEDAHTLAHLLPTSGELLVPRVQGAASWDLRPATPEETRRHFVEQLSKLPDRTFWFSYKKRGFDAVRLVTPTLELDELRRAADAAPAWLRDACLGRTHGMTRRDLEDAILRRQAQMAAVAAGTATTPGPDFSQGPPIDVSPAAPDVPAPVPTADGTDETESEDSDDLPFLG